MPGDSNLEAMEKEHQDNEMAIQQLKEVGWNVINMLLVDEIHSQTLIKTWTSGTKVNLRKKVMKSVCRENLMLEGYWPESLVPVIEVHDQWEAFFYQQSSPQFEEGSSSRMLELEVPDASERGMGTD